MTAPVPGLSVVDSETFLRALSEGCEVRHQVLNLDLSHNLVADIRPMSLDGQVNIVNAGEDGITRTLQMGFIDPDHALRLDSATPTAGFGGLDRLIHVRTFVKSAAMTGWLSAPTFTGRPSTVARDGDTVTIEAQDKACLHLKGVSAYTITKRSNVVDSIKSILTRNGETRFRFPTDSRARMAAGVHVGGADEDRQPWRVAWRLARSIGYQLFYDLEGYACLRIPPDTYAWELHEQGQLANCLTRVKVTTDLTTIRNRVVVTGRSRSRKRGSGSRGLTAVAVPHSAHPLSGQALAMNGIDWYNTEFFDQPDIHTESEAKQFATARLNELLEEQISVETSTFPVWHLQGKDLLRLETATGDAVQVRLLDASIPLGESDAGMTVGYQARVRAATAGRLRKSA